MMEEDLIIELWDVFREYISEKNKEIAANHYVDFLVGQDVKTSVLEGLMGYDPHLDGAIELVLRADGAVDEDDEDDEDDINYYDED
jgi:thiaminase